MSSSTSSSSHSQRTPIPLYERTSSERNQLQTGIRLVPYTPPKIEADEVGSRAAEPETPTGSVDFHSPRDRTSSTSTVFGRGGFTGSESSSPVASSSPITAPTRVLAKGVSEARRVSGLPGSEDPAPPARAVVRTSHGSFIRHVNPPSQNARDHVPTSPTPNPKSASRRDRSISIHADKTFSLVRSVKPSNTRISTGSESTAKSYAFSNTSVFSSHGETSFDAPTEDLRNSLFSSVPEGSVSPSSPSTSATPSNFDDEHTASSPWNYRLAGGLRKVPKTPESKAKGKEIDTSAEPLPTLPETVATARVSESGYPLTQKQSFATERSDSTSEGAANYNIIGRSSPPLPDSDSIYAPPSSSSSNYQVFGQPSAPQSFASSPARGQGPLDTPGSQNFVLHNRSYPASEQSLLETPGSRDFIVHENATPASLIYPHPRASESQTSYDSFGRELSGKYSQESLVIPPLQPHKRSSSENLVPKSRTSRETVHGRSNSYSSISSVLTQDTGPNVVRLAHTSSASSSLRQALWAGRSAAPPKSRMDVHQWSSQLSTVLSEYEGSDRGSRLTSLGSFGDRGSRNIRSISSSMHDNVEPNQTRPQSHSRSRSSSIEQPGVAYMRGARELPNPPVRTVRDHDEHGDGLADLHQMYQLQNKSSRSRVGFLSRHSSDRSSRSASSSRSGSFTSSSIPSWARVYYGSGERRWLGSPINDENNTPHNPWIPARVPLPEQFVPVVHNPRRRPREPSDVMPQRFSPEITPVQPAIEDIPRIAKRKTSSIWSPHLRSDNRASRYSIWRPPSVTWSAENRVFGRRNIQLVLFVLGFIFPFAWMIAAVLPLPRTPQLDMQELDRNTTRFRIPEDPGSELLYRQIGPVDDSRYQSARWWRNLNRYMSILGVLIIGAIIALIVVGVNQDWGK
ncbi:hypothetical protein F4808DRAFT_31424 [Astrocystis sublimbata]|nr:hypothetical protein F4808DRAFT_31424 [Astrocystis sublimbata]